VGLKRIGIMDMNELQQLQQEIKDLKDAYGHVKKQIAELRALHILELNKIEELKCLMGDPDHLDVEF
jgi:phage shock protein A